MPELAEHRLVLLEGGEVGDAVVLAVALHAALVHLHVKLLGVILWPQSGGDGTMATLRTWRSSY